MNHCFSPRNLVEPQRTQHPALKLDRSVTRCAQLHNFQGPWSRPDALSQLMELQSPQKEADSYSMELPMHGGEVRQVGVFLRPVIADRLRDRARQSRPAPVAMRSTATVAELGILRRC